jgi:transposase
MIIVTDARPRVTLGIDTHRDTNVAAVLDDRGVELGVATFPTTVEGHRDLLAWTETFGALAEAGVEGTGSYGAGIARFLQAADVTVIEVDRPNRQRRRRLGKSDPVDAVAAARAVQNGDAIGRAKTRTGPVESIRVLRMARRSAATQRNATLNRMRALVATAPDTLRAQLRAKTVFQLVDQARRLRPGDDLADPANATKFALRQLARRVSDLNDEIHTLEAHLENLIRDVAPELVARKGIGVDTASALLIAAGDNPERLRSEAAWARLCGTGPIDASSGLQQRHRLNRGGNRQANQALWRIVMVRLSYDTATRTYVENRVKEGKTKREAIRCLKRYVAREVFHLLPRDLLDNR